MTTFDRPGLTDVGFRGWHAVAQLRLELKAIPAEPGTYMVLHDGAPPRVLPASTGALPFANLRFQKGRSTWTKTYAREGDSSCDPLDKWVERGRAECGDSIAEIDPV